jgi:hypothetical protein
MPAGSGYYRWGILVVKLCRKSTPAEKSSWSGKKGKWKEPFLFYL